MSRAVFLGQGAAFFIRRLRYKKGGVLKNYDCDKRIIRHQREPPQAVSRLSLMSAKYFRAIGIANGQNL